MARKLESAPASSPAPRWDEKTNHPLNDAALAECHQDDRDFFRKLYPKRFKLA